MPACAISSCRVIAIRNRKKGFAVSMIKAGMKSDWTGTRCLCFTADRPDGG